jgi:hypothetical protein
VGFLADQELVAGGLPGGEVDGRAGDAVVGVVMQRQTGDAAGIHHLTWPEYRLG